MLQNNNLKICRKLIWRDIKFHRGQNILLILAVILVCMLNTFSMCLGSLIYDSYIYSYKVIYGSDSHIICENLSGVQAAAVTAHSAVKDTSRLYSIGTLSDEMLGARTVKLAEVSGKWAQETASEPLHGRMPKEAFEIALDELTMNSLMIPHEIGAEVTLTWTTFGEEEQTGVFRLCGWWENIMGETEACAWIAEETAELLSSGMPEHISLGITLYRPGDLEKQAAQILADLNIQNISFTVNPAYHPFRIDRAKSKAADFYRLSIIVILCGIPMLYHIVQLSGGQNIRFYGRAKSLGMTPRQIRVLSRERAAFLWLSATIPGWILGFLLYVPLAPYVVIGMEKNPAFAFFRIWPFAVSAALTGMITAFACMLPMRSVAKCTPVEAVRFVERTIGKSRGKRRRQTLVQMAWTEFLRHKSRSVFVALSLFLSIGILCFVWTQRKSIDEEVYLKGTLLNDYRISDASAVSRQQRYNPGSRSIKPEILQAISEHPAVLNVGIFCTMEVPMHAAPGERAQIIETFEKEDESGIPLKENMADNQYFMAGYEKMRESGDYIGIVTGINAPALESVMAQNILIEGTFSQELYDTGNYVIAAGASSPDLKVTPPAGSSVTINGRSFEIMASVPYDVSLITGADSRQAEFNVSYYMPLTVFDELFPEHGIRTLSVNIDHGSQKEFEKYLSELLDGTGVRVLSFSDQQKNFRNAVFQTCLIPFFVGSVMFLIGIVNFAGSLVTGILVRRKEFAVYESLGMTKKQLHRMLFLEELFGYGITILFLIPSVAAFTWICGRWWFSHTTIWCITWHYSLMPLWVSLPVLLIPAFLIPFSFLKTVMRESVAERLRLTD